MAPSAGLQSGAALTVAWSDADIGNAAVAGPFRDHVVITNPTTGQTLETQDVAYDPGLSGNGPIAAGQAIARQLAFTLPQGTAGTGQIQFADHDR